MTKNTIKQWLTRLGRPAVWAHRGASSVAPENSLAALRLAADSGADGVEFDVQPCGSGELVVFHDSTLGRCTGAVGELSETSLAALSSLTLDRVSEAIGVSQRGERIPLLADWLRAIPAGLFVNLEVKCDHLVDAPNARRCVAALESAGLSDRAIVSSFHPAALWQAAAQERRIARGVLIEEAGAWAALAGLGMLRGASAIHVQSTLATQERVKFWHRLGLAVAVWTVDEPEEARRCLDAGVDVLISNRPDVMRPLVERYGR